MGGGWFPTRTDPRRRDRISDLLLRQGEIEAEHAARTGDIWGNAFVGIGRSIGGAIAEEPQRKLDASRARREEANAARAEAQVQREGADRGALDEAMTAAGSNEMDPEAIEARLPGHLKLQFRKSMSEAKAASMKFASDKADYMARLALGVQPWIQDPAQAATAVDLALKQAKQDGISGTDELRAQIAQDPTQLPALLRSYIERSPSVAKELRERNKPTEVSPGATLVGPDGKPLYTAPTAEKPPAVGSFEDYVLRKHGEKPTPEQIESARKAYNQADDKPTDPIARELAALRLAEAKEKAAGIEVKPLSGEAAKVFSVATTMIPEIEQLKEAFGKDYGSAVRGVVTGRDRRLVRLVDQVADKVGRLRSGGAINKDEESRFKRQLGTTVMDAMFGKSEDAIAALDGVIAEANNIISNVRPNGVTGPLRRGEPAPPLGRFERAGGKPASSTRRYERID